MRYAAVVLSRQPMRPTGCTPWVKRSVEAVRWLNAEGFGLVSSIDMTTWEILTALASDLRMPSLLVIPSDSTAEFIRECDRAIDEFSLDPDTTGFVPVMPDISAPDPDLSVARDRTVFEKADLLVPVALRKGGNMDSLLRKARTNGRPVEMRFNAVEPESSARLKYDMLEVALNSALRQADRKYLIHWTRGVSAPWPGEKKIGFYRDIIQADCWPRSALDTLKRILKMRRILASCRHMPGDVSAVSFSGLAPREVIPLMRWRARYSEMSFEPYGIGVERRFAADLGIHEVRYFDNEEQLTATSEDRWRWQSKGEITDWRAEQEFRCRGDLDLDSVPPEATALFCRTACEARQLHTVHAGPIWSFLP